MLSLNALGTILRQDFDTLVNSGTSILLPEGWFISEVGTSGTGDGSYSTGTGSSNTDDTYSFGVTESTDRALGTLNSGTNTPTIGAQFTNDTGAVIGSLQVAFTGEQWRLGAIGRTDRLDFQISFDATSLTTGNWIDVNELDFFAPNGAGTVGALDGNAATNRTSVSGTIDISAGIPVGATFWIRWLDFDAAGADDGLAIDNFSITAIGQAANPSNFSVEPASDGEAQGFSDLAVSEVELVPNPNGRLAVTDLSLVEGNSGTTSFDFVVTRASGTTGTIRATWNLAFDTVNAADFALSQATSGTVTFDDGQDTATISILVSGDAAQEADETFTLTLSDPTNGAEISDASATATILNEDASLTAIYTIQGTGLISALVGQSVSTHGIVTVVDTNGFFIQDPAGDGNAATSDAIFVFTASAPTVVVGQSVNVTGTVTEFREGNTRDANPITELIAPIVTVLGSGNALPAAVVIDGSTQPTESIEDGIAFFEALEAMLVTIKDPLVVAATNGRGEIFTVAGDGAFATNLSSRGTINIDGTGGLLDVTDLGPSSDFNPERIQIQRDSFTPGAMPVVDTGAKLNDVTGVIWFSSDNYEVLATSAITVKSESMLTREISDLEGNSDELTIGSYNVQNLDPGDGAQKFAALARDIVFNLNAPDIISLSEVQDNNGTINDSVISASVTLQMLVEAIAAAGGPTYTWIDNTFIIDDQSGGEPGSNSRVAFLYRDDRVNLVEGSVRTVDDTGAFVATRLPLVATFEFNDTDITVVGNDFSSKGGSDGLFGAIQPPSDGGAGRRLEQAQAVAEFVAFEENLVDGIVVLGGFNEFEFEDSLDPLYAVGLENLTLTLAEEERYTYNFDGNSQAIDHIFTTSGFADVAKYDVVHLNSEFAIQQSDHDPLLVSFLLPPPNAAPADLVLSNASIAENSAAGTVVGTLSATDRATDTLRYELIDNAGGRFTVNAVTGVITATAAFDFETAASFSLIAKVSDQGGLSTQQSFQIGVTNVNEAPVATSDTISVNEDGTTNNLWSLLLGNDADPDAADMLRIEAIDDSQTLGTLVFDPTTQSLRYIADDISFDNLATGKIAMDRFTYTVRDQAGLTSTATVEVRVTGIADGVVRYGSILSDTITGTAGEDKLFGLIGNDTLYGLSGQDELWGSIGNDRLFGGDGNDLLSGGLGDDLLNGGRGNDRLSGNFGNDTLTGGAGRDIFAFGFLAGNDTITDFNAAVDTILLESGINLLRTRVRDVNRDGTDDLELTLSGGGSVTLLGVTDVNAVNIQQERLPIFLESLF